MRPKKVRQTLCVPGEKCFRPQCKDPASMEVVFLEYDEYEALRLSDYLGLTQAQVGEHMKVHRSTISRMLQSAQRKIADALTNNKAIQIKACCFDRMR